MKKTFIIIMDVANTLTKANSTTGFHELLPDSEMKKVEKLLTDFQEEHKDDFDVEIYLTSGFLRDTGKNICDKLNENYPNIARFLAMCYFDGCRINPKFTNTYQYQNTDKQIVFYENIMRNYRVKDIAGIAVMGDAEVDSPVMNAVRSFEREGYIPKALTYQISPKPVPRALPTLRGAMAQLTFPDAMKNIAYSMRKNPSQFGE